MGAVFFMMNSRHTLLAESEYGIVAHKPPALTQVRINVRCRASP